MRQRFCSKAFATVLLLALAALGWWLADVSSLGKQSSDKKVRAGKDIPGSQRSSSLSTAQELSIHWGTNVSVHLTLEQKLLQLPALNLPQRKALQNIATQLHVPLLATSTDPQGGSVHIQPGGVLWGERNPQTELALEKFAAASDSQRPEHIHQIAAIEDPRLESFHYWILTQSKDAAQRGAAAFELGTAESADSHQALANALADPDDGVKDQARSAIQQIGSHKMEALLRTAMNSTNDEQAMEAGDLLERALGLKVEQEFWLRFTEK
jgi:hypothetical protein